jgi:hypothetical protein
MTFGDWGGHNAPSSTLADEFHPLKATVWLLIDGDGLLGPPPTWRKGVLGWVIWALGSKATCKSPQGVALSHTLPGSTPRAGRSAGAGREELD